MRYYACVSNHTFIPTSNGNLFTNCLNNRDRGRYVSTSPVLTVGRIYHSIDGSYIYDDTHKVYPLAESNDYFVEVEFKLDETSERIISKMESVGLYVRVEPISVNLRPKFITVCLLYVGCRKYGFSYHMHYTLDDEKSTIKCLQKMWEKVRLSSDMSLSIAKGLNLKIAPYIELLKLWH